MSPRYDIDDLAEFTGMTLCGIARRAEKHKYTLYKYRERGGISAPLAAELCAAVGVDPADVWADWGRQRPTHDPMANLIAPVGPRPWLEQAACRKQGADTSVFFPEDGKATEAKQLCRVCPVRMDCLMTHLNETHGIFGGTNERERRVIRRAIRNGQPWEMPHIPEPPPPPGPPIIRHVCGTMAGVALHRRYREERCGPCEDADARRRGRAG